MLKLIIALCAWAGLTGCVTHRGMQNESFKMEPRISVITLGVGNLQRSYHFYKDGLGFPTKMTPEGGIVLFATSPGPALMLYPYSKLAQDAMFPAEANAVPAGVFPGFTFGHCVRSKAEVDAVLAQVEKAGGTIVKQPITTSWGGYSGYFRDPDGYSWEVLYSDNLKFKPDGGIIVDR